MIDFISTALGIDYLVAVLILVVGIVISFVIYFLPSFIAYTRKCPSLVSIFVLNLLLGWSFLGWVASLVWALRKYDYSAPDNAK